MILPHRERIAKGQLPVVSGQWSVMSFRCCRDIQLGAHKLDDLFRDIFGRRNLEYGPIRDRLERHRLPCRSAMSLMENYSICTIEELTGGCLKIGGRGIENRKVQIRTQELQNAVRFEDHVLGAVNSLTKRWHCFGKTSLFGANPEHAFGAS